MRPTAIPTMILAMVLGGAASVSAQSAEQCFLGATSSSYADGSRIMGNVGTNDAGGRLRFGRRVVLEAGSVASGETVVAAAGSQIAEVRANVLEADKANVGKEGPVVLPLVTEFCPVPAFACGGQDVRVKKGGSVALPPGSYGNVELLNGADLMLSPGTYEFCSLRGGRRATVSGGAGTIVNVQGTLGLSNGSRLGTSGLLTVNVGGDRVKLGSRASVTGLLAAPAAVLDLARGVVWKGRFCAAAVSGGPRLKLECESTPATTTTTTTSTTSTTAPPTTTTTTTSTTSTTAPTTTTTTTSTTSTTAPTTTTTTTSTTSTTAPTTTTTTTAPTTTTTTTTSTTSTTAPTTTTTTTTSTTSTTAPTTTTTTTTTSTTTTTVPQPLTCGASNFLDVTATLVYEPRLVGGVYGMFMEVDYPTGVGLPGTGTASTVRARFTNLLVPAANYRFIGSDTDSNANGVDDRARTLVTANTTEPIPSAAIERIRFDCPSGTVVQPSQFACRPAEAVDAQGQIFPPEVAAQITCALSFQTP